MDNTAIAITELESLLGQSSDDIIGKMKDMKKEDLQELTESLSVIQSFLAS